MSVEQFIADRIARPEQNKGNISRPIVKIGIMGISLGVAVMLVTVSVVLGFKSEIIKKITGLTADIIVSNINLNASNEPEPICMSADSLKQLSTLPGIKTVQRSAFKNALLSTKQENEGLLMKGIERDYDTVFIKQHLVSGRLLQFKEEAASLEIVLSAELTRKLNVEVGDKIKVFCLVERRLVDEETGETYTKTDHSARTLKVVGVFNTGFSDYDAQLGIVDLRLIQALNGWKNNYCGNFEIKVDEFAKLPAALEQVQDFLSYKYSTRSVTEIYSTIFIWLEKLDVNGIIIIVLMILVATINMITALLILMIERANMVGMIKALGMSNASVRTVFLRISRRLVGRGMFWGNIIGIAVCLLQYQFHFLTLDAATYYVDHWAIEINWLYFVLLNVGTLIACSIMLLLPTLILTGMTPLKTLKFD